MKFMENARHIPSDTALAQVFTKHDTRFRSGFITRLDRTTISRKRLSFVCNLIFNLAILSGSATLVLVLISRGFEPNAPDSLRLTFSITQGIILLWATFILIFSTSIPFFCGECRIRWKYGFKSSEIIVRRSPPQSSTTLVSQENSCRAVFRAIDPSTLYANPLSILAADYWVLEYAIILDLYACITRGELNEEDLEFTVWKECDGIWKGLELWRLQYTFLTPQEVALFKAFLTSKGKYELLSAWERLFDCGKTPATQTYESYQSIVKRFSQEGIDYEAVWSRMEVSCAA